MSKLQDKAKKLLKNNDNDFIVVRDENGKRYQVIPQERYLELTAPPNDKEIEKWKREDYDKMSKETLIQIMVDKDDYFEELTTPPTEQEVCEALMEEFPPSYVKYENEAFMFVDEKDIIAYINNLGFLRFNYSLPIKIAGMITRFYEGKVKKDE